MLRHIHVTGLALTVGSVLFLVGAALPPEPQRVFSASLKEHLEIILRGRARWSWMGNLMTAGVIATAAGLCMFAVSMGSPMRAVAGVVGYLIGALLWVLALTFRGTTLLDVAEEADRTGEVPGWVEPMQSWTGRMFWIYMLLAYLAIVAVGWTLISLHILAAWIAWFALVYGIVLGLSFASGFPKVKMWGPVAEPPFLIHVPLLVIGIALLAR